MHKVAPAKLSSGFFTKHGFAICDDDDATQRYGDATLWRCNDSMSIRHDDATNRFEMTIRCDDINKNVHDINDIITC